MPKTIAVVGAGRVGRTLARALRRRGYRIGAVVTRSLRTARAAARFIGAGRPVGLMSDELSRADVVLIATPDGQIARTARLLARGRASWRGRIALHASGALEARELAALKKRGTAVGCFHPMFPFPRPLAVLPPGITFGLSGDARAVRVASPATHQFTGKQAEPGNVVAVAVAVAA